MKRVDLIKEIAAEFELIANRLSETEVATVASVVELEPQHLAEIAKRAQKLTGSKNVKLKTVIDKSLLAGITIRYGNSGSKLSLITLRFRSQPLRFSAAPKISATISVADKLPDATLSYLDASDELQTISIADITTNKKEILVVSSVAASFIRAISDAVITSLS
ncbi:hypothetical protein SASPL_111218 [Salvia splendens]|uniref:Uncharacterized protein n=1 Tax=Salvia splendens TaxID=180675 RepID=A0A8X8Y8L3_SALSN|nr:hypothetical protein SASPL_111218 [Salvia splendens]